MLSGQVQTGGGTLSGTGTVRGPLNNTGGTVAPGLSPGILRVTGSYTQGAGGALNVEVGGTTPGSGHDQLDVSGAASLNGTLNVTTLTGFTPTEGQSFQFLKHASRSGQFATVNGTVSGFLAYEVQYQRHRRAPGGRDDRLSAPEERVTRERLARTRLQRLLRAEPQARPAARPPLVQPAGRDLAAPDRRHGGCERRGAQLDRFGAAERDRGLPRRVR